MKRDLRPISPTRRRMRKAGGILAIVIGSLLIVLERTQALGGEQQGAAWFWIIVALALIAVGLAELLDRGDPPVA